MTKIIILRGNSASGKSTIAKELKNKLEKRVLVLEQDILRLEMISLPSSETHNIQIQEYVKSMILHLLKWAKNKFDVIIFDGQYSNNRYPDMFEKIKSEFSEIYAYYFDLPFEENARRHLTREKSKLFTVEEMRAWRKENNTLEMIKEKIITKEMSKEQITDMILNDIGFKI